MQKLKVNFNVIQFYCLIRFDKTTQAYKSFEIKQSFIFVKEFNCNKNSL